MYGPPERIAKAVVNCKLLTKHVLQNVLRPLWSEVCGLCSRSNPALLRKCDKEDLIKFDFQSLCKEWKDRAPIFYSFLMTCCSVQLSRDESWFSSVAVAGSVLPKQRNSQINALASVLGILIKTRSVEVWFSTWASSLFLHIFTGVNDPLRRVTLLWGAKDSPPLHAESCP